MCVCITHSVNSVVENIYRTIPKEVSIDVLCTELLYTGSIDRTMNNIKPGVVCIFDPVYNHLV